MATRNFSFSLKKTSLCLLLIFIGGCTGLKTREGIRSTPAKSEVVSPAPEITPHPAPSIPEALRPSETVVPQITELPRESTPQSSAAGYTENPKIGLILGPGSARAWAHIGVLQELNKAKLPITQIVGLEMGALIGGIYAQKAQPFDVEWQMSKLKDIKSLGAFINSVFGSAKVEDLKLPFSCPAYNLVKSQYFMMNKGAMSQMLPYCLPVPPLLHSHNNNVAGMTELKASIDYLKSKGANFIVYVNVLPAKNGVITGGLDDESNFLWTLAGLSLSKQWQTVDYVLNVPVQDFDLKDWSKRRELLQKGIEAGQNATTQISKRLGL
jgi:NTE family protein